MRVSPWRQIATAIKPYRKDLLDLQVSSGSYTKWLGAQATVSILRSDIAQKCLISLPKNSYDGHIT
jgi:hypothetical protein